MRNKLPHPSLPIWDLDDAVIFTLLQRGMTPKAISRLIWWISERQLLSTVLAWNHARTNPRDANGQIERWWKEELSDPKRAAYWRKKFNRALKGKL